MLYIWKAGESCIFKALRGWTHRQQAFNKLLSVTVLKILQSSLALSSDKAAGPSLYVDNTYLLYLGARL